MTSPWLDCSTLPDDPVAFYGAALKNGKGSELLQSCCEKHRSMLCDVCLPSILLSTYGRQSFPNAIEASRVLNSILDVIYQSDINPGFGILTELLNYVWNHWSKYTEVVRWNCCTIMVKVVKFYLKRCPRPAPFLCLLIKRIVLNDNCTKARYKCLEMLLPLLERSSLLQLLELKLPDLCLQAIENSEDAAHAGAFFVAMAEKDMEVKFSKSWATTWLEPVFEKMVNSVCSSDTTPFAELLLKLIPVDAEVFLATASKYLPPMRQRSTNSIIQLYLSAASVGWQRRRNNPDGATIVSTVNRYLFHQDRQIAIAALRLMVDQPKTCLPVEAEHFEQLLKFLSFNAHEQEPSFCEAVIFCVNKTFERIRGSACWVKTHSFGNWPQVSEDYKNFLKRLNSWAVDCLVQNVQFQPRYCALRVLDLLYASDKWCSPSYDLNKDLEIDQLRKDSWSVLFETLTDCYDKNQTIAFGILRRKPTIGPSYSVYDVIVLFLINYDAIVQDIEEQLSWARSVLPRSLKLLEISAAVCMIRVGIAVAHKGENNVRATLVWAIDELRKSQSICKESASVNFITSRASIYGIITLVRLLMQDLVCGEVISAADLGHFIEVVTRCCVDIAASILPALQDGYFVDADLSSIYDESSQVDVTNSRQVLTLVSWRIIKEINALFSSFVIILPLSSSGSRADNDFALSMVLLICDHFLTVFTSTNHRGVFETAGLFFKEICHTMSRSTQLAQIRNDYADLVVKKLEDGEGIFRLNMRSGGLPFMVSCLLYPEVKDRRRNSLLFFGFLNRIVAIAEGARTTGVKVNCLNVLDKILRTANLTCFDGERLRSMFKLALAELASHDWMIQSAAQLLLVAWLRRVFGTPNVVGKFRQPKSCRLSDVELDRLCPGIFYILVSSLQRHLVNNVCTMDVFASLTILSNVYPSSWSSASASRPAKIWDCLLLSMWQVVNEILLTSPVERFRYMAARALVSILPPWKLYLLWKELKRHILSRPISSQNGINGLLHLVATQDQYKLRFDGKPLISNDELLQFGRHMFCFTWAPTNSAFLIELLLSRGCQLPYLYSTFLHRQLVIGGSLALETYRDVAARCAAQSEAKLEQFRDCVVKIPSLRLALYKVLAKNLNIQITTFPGSFQRLLLNDVLECEDEKFIREAVKAYVAHSNGMKSEIGKAETLQRLQKCKDGRSEQLKLPRTVAYFTLFVAHLQATVNFCQVYIYFMDKSSFKEHSSICWVLDSILRISLVRDGTTANVCLKVMEFLASRYRTELSKHCLANVIFMIMLQKTDCCIRRQAANIWSQMQATNDGDAHPEQCLNECLLEIGSSKTQCIVACYSQLLAVENVVQECVADTSSSLDAQSPFVRNNFDCLLEAPLNLQRLLNSTQLGNRGGWQPSPLCNCRKVEENCMAKKISDLRALCARGSASIAHKRIIRHVEALLERCAEDAPFNCEHFKCACGN
ncbi:hypothetical protein D918_09501 [Trichuris suis]|nr:hypothetical protein D918_09501 [Trichuris suis]